eukprot:752763-Prymnesium_polylepis.1
MEMSHLHALFKSALVQPAHPLRSTAAALCRAGGRRRAGEHDAEHLRRATTSSTAEWRPEPHDLTDDAGDRQPGLATGQCRASSR